MANKGWVKIHRSLIENEVWKKERFTPGQAWVDLILLANGADNGEYKRGSVYRGKDWLAKRWKWDRSTVTRYLDNLEKDGMVTQKRTHGGTHNATVITIVKWGFFQDNATQNTTQNATRNATPKRRKEEKTVSALPTAAEIGIARDPMQEYLDYIKEKQNEL